MDNFFIPTPPSIPREFLVRCGIFFLFLDLSSQEQGIFLARNSAVFPLCLRSSFEDIKVLARLLGKANSEPLGLFPEDDGTPQPSFSGWLPPRMGRGLSASESQVLLPPHEYHLHERDIEGG